MKQILFLLILIVWAILQARRKAMREQARKQAMQARASQEPTPPVREMQPREQRIREMQNIALGPVTAEENQAPAPRWVERARTVLGENEMPDEVRTMIKASRKTKEKATDDSQAEKVEEIVTPASESAYETTSVAKRRIVLNPESLRTFVVTREILGPARSRNPHRPGIRGK